MIDNIGYAPDKIARHLDLATSTVRRYIAEGQAPKPVMLALFWETSWGIATANAVAINETRRFYAENQMLKRQIAAQYKHIALLECELERGHFSANSPVFHLK